LVLEPRVLLCDEPTANVDSEHQEIILEALQKANRDSGTTVIFSTHYLGQAQRLADVSLVLQDGRLSDIGSENLFKIHGISPDKGWCLCQLSGQIYLQLSSAMAKGLDRDAGKIHLDPRKIRCDFQRSKDSPRNSFGGHVIEIGQHSGEARVVIDIGIKLSVYLPMAAYREHRPALGDRVDVTLPDDAITIGGSTF
jgi:energy-coupling factor transporter ATP-binding protein EcfA2